MIDYAHLYHTLFNAVTAALEHMEPDTAAADILRSAQQQTEEEYMETAE